MVSDANKKISGIVYNYLNLPSTVAVTDKGTITYTYDASGTKWRKTTVDKEHGITTVTTYLGGIEYRNDTVQFFGSSEGRYRLDSSHNGYIADYFLKDHLGNTRMVLTDDPRSVNPILEETHYYPFGMAMAGIGSEPATAANKYRFNGGTELNSDFDIDLYETPNRGYDAQIGRFHQVDGLADSYSGITPYQFGNNNPLQMNDPTGLAARGSSEWWAEQRDRPTQELINDRGPTFADWSEAYQSQMDQVEEGFQQMDMERNLQNWSNLLTGLSVGYSLGMDVRYNVNDVIVSPLEDVINVNSKDKTVTVTQTDSPYDVVIVNGSEPFTRSKEGSKKLLDFYERVGYSIRNPKALGTTLSDAVSLAFIGSQGGAFINGLISLLRKSDKDVGRIQANSLKEFKSLVQQLSKPGSQLTKNELQQFEKLTEQFGGKLRYDLNPIKGKNLQPHVQVEGLGTSVGSRHIWLEN